MESDTTRFVSDFRKVGRWALRNAVRLEFFRSVYDDPCRDRPAKSAITLEERSASRSLDLPLGLLFANNAVGPCNSRGF